MKFRFVVLVIAASIILTGCVSKQRRTALKDLYRATVPECVGEQDCKDKWSAAQIWVSRNCGMKIQIANDTIINTYNSSRNSTRLAASVTKEPMGNDKYRIIIRTGCNNIFGCSPDAVEAAIEFNNYVAAN